jgi:hypothetical protein
MRQANSGSRLTGGRRISKRSPYLNRLVGSDKVPVLPRHRFYSSVLATRRCEPPILFCRHRLSPKPPVSLSCDCDGNLARLVLRNWQFSGRRVSRRFTKLARFRGVLRICCVDPSSTHAPTPAAGPFFYSPPHAFRRVASTPRRIDESTRRERRRAGTPRGTFGAERSGLEGSMGATQHEQALESKTSSFYVAVATTSSSPRTNGKAKGIASARGVAPRAAERGAPAGAAADPAARG